MPIQKMLDSSTPYESGGVLEASKFAKGDGWKDKTSVDPIPISVPQLDDETRKNLIEDLQNNRPFVEILQEYRFFREMLGRSKQK